MSIQKQPAEFFTISKVQVIQDVVIDMRTPKWCQMKYPDHPNGCPNVGKKKGCPPSAPFWNDVAKPPYILVAIRFNLANWAAQMKSLHQGMSDRQAECCLYWQGTVRKLLRKKCEETIELWNSLGPVRNWKIFYCPEAMCVHVFETCYKNGIKLHKNPKDFVWKIAIIAESK